MREPRAVSIIIAEELTLVREGLIHLCESLGGFRVVAQCGGGSQVLAEIAARKPDLAIIDSNLSDCSALDIVRRVAISGSRTKILLIGARHDRKAVLEALRAGAS